MLERFSDSLGSDWARDERRERRGEVRRERVVDTAIECLPHFIPEERPEGFGGSTAGGAHEGFELREAEFNGIEVRTVGRQIAERGADALDRLADAGHFVCAEVIGDDDVPGMQGGHEDLFDIGEEARPVDGAVEDRGGPRNSDSLLRWDPDPGEGVWHATEETELSG